MKELENKIKELESIIQDSVVKLKEIKEYLNIPVPLECTSFFISYDNLRNWLNKNGIEYSDFYIFEHGDWKYKDIEGFEYLFRDRVELTKNVRATNVWSYDNGNWGYMDEQDQWHQFDENNNEIE